MNLPNSHQVASAQPLISYFELFSWMPGQMKSIIANETSSVFFLKNKFITGPSDNRQCLYFIVKGSVRGFVKDGGQEITTWICTEGSIVGAIAGDLSFRPEKHEYIQALEKVEAISIPYKLIDVLYTMFPEMSIIGRKILRLFYHEVAERNFMIRLSSGEKRFHRLMQTHPHFFIRITMKYLASYLGMRLETLSRLRGRIMVREKELRASENQ
ncbi:Crp/Fnr family transcriptional regulator [Pedobacter miscanthi]|uniref:Crp/Fnr family transcriptional regulator n=1 Tax=Pedobacter miscanthi TaxID=2259170 RepID=UPI00292DA0D3|nr:Crp/Fnr family transcriptional regulator [Pedobacter miscanthi]